MRSWLAALVVAVGGVGLQPFITDRDWGTALLLVAFTLTALLVVTSPQVRRWHPDWKLRLLVQRTGAPQRVNVPDGRELAPITESIVDRVLENTTIILDGKDFQDCTFRNCTLRWNGRGKWALSVKLEGLTRIESPEPRFTGTVDLLKALGFLTPEFAATWTHLPIEHFRASTDDPVYGRRLPRAHLPSRTSPIEVLFDRDDPTYSSVNRFETGSPHYYRLGIRATGSRSVKRIKVTLVGIDGGQDGLWQDPVSNQLGSAAIAFPLRESSDTPPFARSQAGITIDPSTVPTLFLLTCHKSGEPRFDVLFVPANANMPLNPLLSFRLRLEVTGEDIETVPVAMKLWTTLDGQLLCKMLPTLVGP